MSVQQSLRVAAIQRVCPAYRRPVFAALSDNLGADFQLFIGADLPNSKVRSSEDLHGVNVVRVPTRFLALGRRVLPWHVGLVNQLKSFNPDVILCEGESHFLGYLQAIYYRLVHNRRVALIHWCFITLPGRPNARRDPAGVLKERFRRFFAAFLVYSTYSRQCLLERGVPAARIFVATNVSDVSRFLSESGQSQDKAALRESLGLAQRFTVLYSGTMDANKRPDLVLDLAAVCCPSQFSFVMLGAGPLLQPLQERARRERLSNVFFAGRVTGNLTDYYCAADVLIVPGRGGMVISEAMACGLPVVVHQADGTEFDLVEDHKNGFRVNDASTLAFLDALNQLRNDPSQQQRMATHSRRLIKERFNTDTMVAQILAASQFAASEANTAMKSS